jgi:aconitase A
MREYLREKAKDPITKKYFSKKELNFISTPKPVVNYPIPKIDFSTIPPVASAPTPEERAMEQRFNQMMEENRKEKIKNQNSGLAGLIGGGSKLYE